VVGLAVVLDGVLLVPEGDLLHDFGIQIPEGVLGESVVLEVLDDLVVNELGDAGSVAVLELELINEHAFELLSLLDVDELVAFVFC
jgi:hypothetical protein